MKFNFKNVGEPFIDIAAGTAGAILSNQFLDFAKMFPTVDPTSFPIVHQGGIKAAAAGLSIGLWGKKMPSMLKYAIIGVGIAGAIKEARQLSNGTIITIGSDERGSDTSQLDRLLKEAAKKSISSPNMMGANDSGAGVGWNMGANDSGAGVGIMNASIPNMDYGSTVGSL